MKHPLAIGTQVLALSFLVMSCTPSVTLDRSITDEDAGEGTDTETTPVDKDAGAVDGTDGEEDTTEVTDGTDGVAEDTTTPPEDTSATEDTLEDAIATQDTLEDTTDTTDTDVANPDPCEGLDIAGICEGAVLKYCENKKLVVEDCNGINKICDISPQDGYAYCFHPTPTISFTQAVSFGSGDDQTAMTTPYDINNDGHLDLFLANGRHDQETNVYQLADGKGGFADPITFSEQTKSYAVRIADIDNDKKMDVIVANTEPDLCMTYQKAVSGGLLKAVPVDPVAKNIRNLEVADVDGNGIPDFIVACRNCQNWVGLNDGTAPFKSVPFGTGEDGTVGLVVRDMDNNGTLDIVVANRLPQPSGIYRGDGEGQFPQESFTQVGNGTENARWVAVADINGDQLMDVVLVQDQGQDKILLQTAGFKFQEEILLGPDNSPSYTVAAADLNKDGHVDIVIGRHNEANIIYLQKGSDNANKLDFSTEVPIGVENLTYNIVPADMDNDGDLDLIISNSSDKNVIYYQD